MGKNDKRSLTERLLDGETIDLGNLPGASSRGIIRAPVRFNRDGELELTSGFGLDGYELAVLRGQVLRDVTAAIAARNKRR